jgi:hypothetical protein
MQEGHSLSPDETDLLMAGLLEFQIRYHKLAF